MEAPRELARLREAWLRATARIERARIWRRVLEIHAEETFTIGLIGAVPQPVVADARLRNIPDKGIYNWDPGAHFGIYRPDQFWLDKTVQEAAR
jgi:peptide/nickel transport system substrate-binding protein